jgi:nucleoside-diphosphate-sugar epimerase
VTTLVVGCGYLGRRVGRLLADRGEHVFGTTRSPARAGERVAIGIEPVVADVLKPETLHDLPDADRVLYCVGFDRSAGMPMRAVYVDGLRHALGALGGRASRLIYASSTGVYGQDDGGWVDEHSPTSPRHESGRVALEAEGLAREVGASRALPVVVLRFAGLYGPGRLPGRDALLRGEPIVGDPARFLNLVHIDDAAAAAVAALDRGEPGRTYLVSNDRPVERREYYALAAECLGAPAPRFVPWSGDDPGMRREETNKRVSNRRMKAELGFALSYPGITTGVPAAVQAERPRAQPS